MAPKSSIVLGILMLVIFMLISFSEVVAQDSNDLILARRELSAGSQVVKEIYQIYKYWDRRKKVMEIANWTITQAENHVDEQCHNSQQYCCLNDIYLDCLQCCQGPRPSSSALIFSPAPAPLPSTTSNLLFSIALQFLLLLFVVIHLF